MKSASWPGHPSDPDAALLDGDISGRSAHEVHFDAAGPKIGRFNAIDFFHDGSFFLLDAPGHAPGHLCALARTTVGPSSSFVFMGADACHHPGVLRPSPYLPLPREIELFTHESKKIVGASLQELTQERDPSKAFFNVSRGPTFHDYDAAMDTVKKIQELDAAEEILVLIAHDLSVRDKIQMFPERINEWHLNDLKKKTQWLFLRDFIDALL